MAIIKGYTDIHSSPPSARVWVLEVGFDMTANVQDRRAVFITQDLIGLVVTIVFARDGTRRCCHAHARYQYSTSMFTATGLLSTSSTSLPQVPKDIPESSIFVSNGLLGISPQPTMESESQTTVPSGMICWKSIVHMLK